MTIRGRHVEFGVRVLGALLLAVFALAVFSWLALEVREGETLQFDSLVRNTVHQHASPAVTIVMKGFTVIGASVCTFVVLAAAVISFWLAGMRRAAIMLLIAMAGSLVLELSLKHVFHRARPEPYFNVPLPGSYSFPSGHALAAACLYGMLAYLVTARVHRRGTRIAVWMFCLGMIVMIGLSRIYLGVHYPSDVVAGYMTACVWLVMLNAAIDRFKASSAAAASQARRPSSAGPRT